MCNLWYLIITAVCVSLPVVIFILIAEDIEIESNILKKLESCKKALTAQSFEARVEDSSEPEFTLSNGRSNVSIVLGIPTIQRQFQNYLMNTLNNLINNMNDAEMNDTLIVVLVADTDLSYVRQIAEKIQLKFGDFVDCGLIEVISPSASYYSKMENLRITLNDPINRVMWRSKQNLDYAFLMNHAQKKARFYVQLEDDVVTQPGFITKMQDFIETCENQTWYVLSFCKLGFIGKLFRSSDLPDLIAYLRTFYNDKPSDWLLDLFITTRYCNKPTNTPECTEDRKKAKIRKSPSLFQHVGRNSSLKGKCQWQRDNEYPRNFSKLSKH